MNSVGISLGWNCGPAGDGIKLGLRKTKEEGYQTCPFDMMVSNYIGLCECIKDDFKYFCDPEYIQLRKAPRMSIHIPNQNDEEMWIYNTKYNFAFNHESPGHGNLYLGEGWVGGINHFVENNFENFIARYTKRINSFRTYLQEADYINFIMVRYNSIPYELVDIIKERYPNLKFKVNSIINYHMRNCLHPNGDENYYESDYLRYMNVDEVEHEAEYLRYKNPYMFEGVDPNVNDNILLIDPRKNPILF